MPTFDMTPMIDITFQLLIFFMLSMSWKEAEGRLWSHLAQGDDGLSLDQPVRLLLCLDGDAHAHTYDKTDHDAAGRSWPDMSVAHLFVGGTAVGIAALEGGTPTPGADALYDAAARAAAELRRATGATAIEIDADGEVASQHVVGVLNALHRHGETDTIRFAANPRLR